MLLLYGVLQQTLQKLIDWLMTCWLWANRHQKQAEGRKKHDR